MSHAQETCCPYLLRLGLNVRKRREDRSFIQEDLAEKANFHQTHISGVERGVRNPSMLVVARMAKALGISVSELTRGINGFSSR